jgi:hypothetical protein
MSPLTKALYATDDEKFRRVRKGEGLVYGGISTPPGVHRPARSSVHQRRSSVRFSCSLEPQVETPAMKNNEKIRSGPIVSVRSLDGNRVQSGQPLNPPLAEIGELHVFGEVDGHVTAKLADGVIVLHLDESYRAEAP